jgi:hypothetical protein
MNAVDTNILIYVNDPRDPIKQKILSNFFTRLFFGCILY